MIAQKVNIGLNLLRIWLSFEVVVDHFGKNYGVFPDCPITRFIRYAGGVAVPCFFVMTFFLTAGRFASRDGGWLRKRFSRLLVPYVCWPVVYIGLLAVFYLNSETFRSVVGNLAIFRYFNTALAPHPTDLLWQWGFGSSPRLAMQFWFHADLMFQTILVFLLFRWMPWRRTAYVIAALTLFAYAFQYSPAYRALFADLPFECKWTLARLVTTFPFVAIGLALSTVRGRLDSLGHGERLFLFLAGLWMVFFFYAGDVAPRPQGFGCQGVHFSFIALGTVTAFYVLPFERIPKWVGSVVMGASRYCMGIYCCHLALGWILYAYVFPHIGIGRESLVSCLAVWLVGWALCWAIARLPGRFWKMLVD